MLLFALDVSLTVVGASWGVFGCVPDSSGVFGSVPDSSGLNKYAFSPLPKTQWKQIAILF